MKLPQDQLHLSLPIDYQQLDNVTKLLFLNLDKLLRKDLTMSFLRRRMATTRSFGNNRVSKMQEKRKKQKRMLLLNWLWKKHMLPRKDRAQHDKKYIIL